MTQDTRPQRVAEFQLEQMDEDLLLYYRGTTRTIHLNQSASLVWQLCDGQHTVGGIAGLLREAYPEAETIDDDVQAAVARLVQEGALVLV